MSGARPPLLLLHAFGAAGRSFSPLIRRLLGQRVHAPDLPGSGGAPALQKPSLSAYSDWVEDYVSRESLADVVLGGWSMGGKIAMGLALRRPDWLRSLVLIAPSPLGPEPMAEDDRQMQLAGYGDTALARRSVTSLMIARPPGDWVDDAVADRLGVSEGMWRWWLEDGSREDLTPSDTIATPSLVLVGSGDDNLGEDVQRRMTLPLLAKAELASVPECGHFLPLEQPEASARRILDWLGPG